MGPGQLWGGCGQDPDFGSLWGIESPKLLLNQRLDRLYQLTLRLLKTQRPTESSTEIMKLSSLLDGFQGKNRLHLLSTPPQTGDAG